ncbi:MAG TPA: DoxX family protein [Cyclobacteriaceae bacterium]|nr:DoxX family protein [Cyclobacteriaceae bacterium]
MKRDKIIYRVATGLLAAGMGMSAFMYLTKNPELVGSFQTLGFPLYFISILGVAKLLGAVVLVAPAGTRLKEWAYAGFIFTFVGATWTHLATHTPFVGPVVFLVVLGVSYFFWVRVRSQETGVRREEEKAQRRDVSQRLA